MKKSEFSKARKKLEKTQKELSELLGVSLKTIHSYEQGWRSIPAHAERQLFFLLANQRGKQQKSQPCWKRKKCKVKEECPAWEFQSGHLCWFFCGTRCDCTKDANSKDKMEICRSCEVITNLLEKDES